MKHIKVLATTYVARRGFRVEGEMAAEAVHRYKASALAMIRERLSMALHMAVSEKVEKYLTICTGLTGQDAHELQVGAVVAGLPKDGLRDQ